MDHSLSCVRPCFKATLRRRSALSRPRASHCCLEPSLPLCAGAQRPAVRLHSGLAVCKRHGGSSGCLQKAAHYQVMARVELGEAWVKDHPSGYTGPPESGTSKQAAWDDRRALSCPTGPDFTIIRGISHTLTPSHTSPPELARAFSFGKTLSPWTLTSLVCLEWCLTVSSRRSVLRGPFWDSV